MSLGPGYGGYNELLKAVDFTEMELMKNLSFKEERYQRIRLYDSTLIEAILTCWYPGQEGEIHNFNGSVSWFKVLRGSVDLENFELSKSAPNLKYRQTFKVGEQCFLDDELGFHRFRNSTKETAVMLHLNSEKMETRKIYNPSTGELVLSQALVDKSYDS